jgi:hypothetical protein
VRHPTAEDEIIGRILACGARQARARRGADRVEENPGGRNSSRHNGGNFRRLSVVSLLPILMAMVMYERDYYDSDRDADTDSEPLSVDNVGRAKIRAIRTRRASRILRRLSEGERRRENDNE